MDPAAIAIALREIAARPSVRHVGTPKIVRDEVQVLIDLDLGFGDRWLAAGKSPTGTLPIERIRLDFPRTFPLRAPRPSLRTDFVRAHAHFQPSSTFDGRPVPCIVFGDLNEFVAARGVGGLIDQLVLWLQRAAEGSLCSGPRGGAGGGAVGGGASEGGVAEQVPAVSEVGRDAGAGGPAGDRGLGRSVRGYAGKKGGAGYSAGGAWVAEGGGGGRNLPPLKGRDGRASGLGGRGGRGL